MAGSRAAGEPSATPATSRRPLDGGHERRPVVQDPAPDRLGGVGAAQTSVIFQARGTAAMMEGALESPLLRRLRERRLDDAPALVQVIGFYTKHHALRLRLRVRLRVPARP